MPSPRMEKLATPLKVPISSKATLGMLTARSVKPRIFRASIWPAPSAVTESGASSSVSSRFRAVTTTSSSKEAMTLPRWDSCASAACRATAPHKIMSAAGSAMGFCA